RAHPRLRKRGTSRHRGTAEARRGDGRVRAARARRVRRNVSRAVVLSGVRTPIGRRGGALAGIRPDDLAATVISEAVQRAGVRAKPEYGDGTEYDTQLGWRFPNPRLEEKFPLESMGETGENVAERWHVSREEQDAFALRSQQRWSAAAAAGRFDDELVSVDGI